MTSNSSRTDTKHTAQKMKFSIKDFFSKCEQIRSFLRICSHLLKKSLMENFIFCAVTQNNEQQKSFFKEYKQNADFYINQTITTHK